MKQYNATLEELAASASGTSGSACVTVIGPSVDDHALRGRAVCRLSRGKYAVLPSVYLWNISLHR
jgi:hypothetical protein